MSKNPLIVYFSKNPLIVVWKGLLYGGFYFIMKKEINAKALGVNIKYYREQKSISASRLAEMADVSVSHINNIESASVNASAKVLVQIANALEVPIDVLLCDSLQGATNRLARLMEYNQLLSDCSETERKIIMGTLRELKKQLQEARDH